MALLDVRGLVKIYGSRKVVDGVSFEVNAGEVVGLLGPNGAGKTTSFRMTTGQVQPYDGIVSFNGAVITHLPMFRRARLGMGYLSQEPSVFRKLSVEKNLLAILEALPQSRTLGRKLTRTERWDRTDAALARFNLTGIRKNPAARCSGGEKRRLEIARCLVCEPLLILLDEPFAAVDPITKQALREDIRALADSGIGILLTDHDVREVLKITDRSYLITEGKVVCHGTPEEIKRNPIAVKGYLGSTFDDELHLAHAERILSRPAVAQPQVYVPPPPLPPDESAPILLQLPTNPPPEREPDPPPPPGPNSGRPVAETKPYIAPPRPSVAPKPTMAPPPPVTIRDEMPAIPLPPTVPMELSIGSAIPQVIEQEKLRRLVQLLHDPHAREAAGQQLVAKGPVAVPVLLDALETRDPTVRYLAYRLLEQITGEVLPFDPAGADDVRLRQAAQLRAKLDRRRSA